jgi:hypothetical protein
MNGLSYEQVYEVINSFFVIFLITNLGSYVLNIFDLGGTKIIEVGQGKMR